MSRNRNRNYRKTNDSDLSFWGACGVTGGLTLVAKGASDVYDWGKKKVKDWWNSDSTPSNPSSGK